MTASLNAWAHSFIYYSPYVYIYILLVLFLWRTLTNTPLQLGMGLWLILWEAVMYSYVISSQKHLVATTAAQLFIPPFPWPDEPWTFMSKHQRHKLVKPQSAGSLSKRSPTHLDKSFVGHVMWARKNSLLLYVTEKWDYLLPSIT